MWELHRVNCTQFPGGWKLPDLGHAARVEVLQR